MTEDLHHFGFENGARVPVTWPDLGEPECPDSDEAEGQCEPGEIAGRIVAILSQGSVVNAGQRVKVLAYLLGQTDLESRHDCAKWLRVSHQRISKIIADLPSELRGLANLKSRSRLRSQQ